MGRVALRHRRRAPIGAVALREAAAAFFPADGNRPPPRHVSARTVGIRTLPTPRRLPGIQTLGRLPCPRSPRDRRPAGAPLVLPPPAGHPAGALDQRRGAAGAADERPADLQRPPGALLGFGLDLRQSVARHHQRARPRRHDPRRRDGRFPHPRHDRRARPVEGGRHRGGARLPVLGDAAGQPGPRHRAALAFPVRVAAGDQRGGLPALRPGLGPAPPPPDPGRRPDPRLRRLREGAPAPALPRGHRGQALQRHPEADLPRPRARPAARDGARRARHVARDGRGLAVAHRGVRRPAIGAQRPLHRRRADRAVRGGPRAARGRLRPRQQHARHDHRLVQPRPRPGAPA